MRQTSGRAALLIPFLLLASSSAPASASVDDTVFWLTGWIFGKRTEPSRDIGICNPICLTGQSHSGPWERSIARVSHIGIDGQDAPFIAVHETTPTCTIRLDRAAPTGGVLVLLSSSDSTVIAPPEWVMISEGDSSISFPIDVVVTAKPRTVMITAKDGNVTFSAKVTVSPPPRGGSRSTEDHVSSNPTESSWKD